MSLKLNPNCYGFATRCRKLYFCFVGCRKPEKVGNHWHIHLRMRSVNAKPGTFCRETPSFVVCSVLLVNWSRLNISLLYMCNVFL